MFSSGSLRAGSNSGHTPISAVRRALPGRAWPVGSKSDVLRSTVCSRPSALTHQPARHSVLRFPALQSPPAVRPAPAIDAPVDWRRTPAGSMTQSVPAVDPGIAGSCRPRSLQSLASRVRHDLEGSDMAQPGASGPDGAPGARPPGTPGYGAVIKASPAHRGAGAAETAAERRPTGSPGRLRRRPSGAGPDDLLRERQSGRVARLYPVTYSEVVRGRGDSDSEIPRRAAPPVYLNTSLTVWLARGVSNIWRRNERTVPEGTLTQLSGAGVI